MKTINVSYIQSFKPCEEGINNFIKHHNDFNGSIIELLRLDNIPYSDKIWLASKHLTLTTLQMWSVDCAESVVKHYDTFDKNNNLRDIFVTVRKVIKGELPESAARSAAALARSAARLAASAAESAARSAVWSAVWSAASAAESAARLAVWSAELAARSAAASAELAASAAAEKEQEQLNIELLIKAIEQHGE